MKNYVMEFLKKYMFGFILGSLFFNVIGVYGVTYFPSSSTTYNNSESGMSSVNVQDGLDELYKVCK